MIVEAMTPMLNLLPDSTPLANQVAGHQNVLSDASGSLVIKVWPSQSGRRLAIQFPRAT